MGEAEEHFRLVGEVDVEEDEEEEVGVVNRDRGKPGDSRSSITAQLLSVHLLLYIVVENT